jgi:hypothetical protein
MDLKWYYNCPMMNCKREAERGGIQVISAIIELVNTYIN